MSESHFEFEESDFDWLANLYARNNGFNHPSELQGLLVGHLSAGGRYTQDEWFHIVCDHMGLESPEEAVLQPNTLDHLQEIYHQNEARLNSSEMDVELLLPSDSFELSQRLEGLGAWARGFLEGVALCAGEGLAQADADIQELIRDFVNISQIAYHKEDEGAEGSMEVEFMEVCEYVRVGVMTIFDEFNEPDPTSNQMKPKPTLH
jgi:uncharacterized protein YgfB (UPF0149 family)